MSTVAGMLDLLTMQILPFLHDILCLPVDELAFFRIEVDSDHRDLLRRLKILFEIGFSLDLRQRGIVIVEFELKQVDVIVRLDNRINPAVIRAGFRFDIESEQTENRIENGLECCFALLVDCVRHPGEERFENLPRLIQIVLQECGCQIRREAADFALRSANVTVQQIGTE